MALFKIGTAYINSESFPVYLCCGNAVRDGEDAPIKGKPHSKVSVAAVENEDGSTVFVQINGWRKRASDVAAVRKGDTVMAVGRLMSRESEGKTYFDLDAEYISVGGVPGRKRAQAPLDAPGPSVPEFAEPEFTDFSDAEDLPF